MHKTPLILALALLPRALGAAPDPALAKRGEYLVTVMGCADCHTPLKMGPQGPEPDRSRWLSGHPADAAMPPAPKLGPGPWGWVGAADMTSFSGPWGVSFSANLTSDPETGIGAWSEQTFITAIRSGKHQGKGRDILPPMPWQTVRQATDADLKAVFAYLQSTRPIRNAVPDVIPPITP